MPIGNITQTMSTISPPPHRGVDVQTVFVNKQEDFQDHLADITITELNTIKDQLNTRIGEINSTATTMNGYVNDAFMRSSTATTKAGEASTSATAALNSKNQASTSATNALNSATKASQWADNNYNALVEAGKYSAKHWATVAQNATVNKVDKVTSTDNAIVRFDGTTGAVQNSSVIIDDNGNVGIGHPNPTTKLDVNGNIRTACSSGDAVNTRGIIFGIDGNTHGRLAVDNNNSLLYIGSGGMGYGTGSGGTVTQLTSKSTAVTLNKPCGQITMHNAALAQNVKVPFLLYNSFITVRDNIILSITAGTAELAQYEARGRCADGVAEIIVSHTYSSILSDAIVLNFAIIKGANS